MISKSALEAVSTHLTKQCSEAEYYLEISSWLVNPDLSHRAIVALALPAAVWAFVSLIPVPFAGVAALRASNSAARTLRQLGAEPILHNNEDLIIEDSFYRGPVQFMVLHSRRYHHEIKPLVQECAEMLQGGGVIAHS